MNLQEKADKVRQALDLLIGHHDAPKKEVEDKVAGLKAYMDEQMKGVDAARKSYEERRKEQSDKVRAAADRAAGRKPN
jgi:hypothetical protein